MAEASDSLRRTGPTVHRAAKAAIAPDAETTIERYVNDVDDRLRVDLLVARDVPTEGLTTYATLNLHDDTATAARAGGRTELLAVVSSSVPDFLHVLVAAGCKFLRGSHALVAGCTVSDTGFAEYGIDTEVQGLLLTEPSSFDELADVELPLDPPERVSWLQALPVTDAELEFATEFGAQALLELIGDRGADVTDLHRPSVLDDPEGRASARVGRWSEQPPRLPTAPAVLETFEAGVAPRGETTVHTVQGEYGEWLYVAACDGVIAPALTALSTLNLHLVPNRVEEGERRVELMMLGPGEVTGLREVLVQAGLHVASGRASSRPGRIYANLVAEQVPDTTVPHAWLTFARDFPDLDQVPIAPELTVYWLLLMPISAAELEFMETVGGDELAALLHEAGVAYWDPYRPSVV